MNERATANANPPDMAAFWMAFTANRQFKSAPRLLASAKGMYYESHDGRRILDGTAGLWCVNAGHCRDEIVAAVQAQAAEMDCAGDSVAAASTIVTNLVRPLRKLARSMLPSTG